VGLRAGLDTEARGKILCPCRGSNPDRPVVQSVVRHYEETQKRKNQIRKNSKNETAKKTRKKIRNNTRHH
jgi:hypothetical protein